MFRLLLLAVLLSLLSLSLSAPVSLPPGTVIHLPSERGIAEGDSPFARASTGFGAGSIKKRSRSGGVGRWLRKRLNILLPVEVDIEKTAVPAAGLTESALAKCFYVGSDLLMHDCNEVLNKTEASINSAKTPEELAIVASVSASLAAKAAEATAT